jgi:hypothetical protein
MIALVGPHPAGDITEAKQAAMASYTRFGFEAAAVTVARIALAASMPIQPKERGLERAAELRFDHPYAALALAGSEAAFSGNGQDRSPVFGLPLFSAWVGTPEEPEADAQ